MVGGKKPKPKHLKLLEGVHESKINMDEPKPAPLDDFSPPKILKGVAKKEWLRLIPDLHATGMLTKIDTMVLANLCLAYGKKMEAEKHLRKDGMTIIGSQGHPITSPWVKISKMASDEMIRIMVEFGMTPSSRQRISVNPLAKDEDDETERLLTRVK